MQHKKFLDHLNRSYLRNPKFWLIAVALVVGGEMLKNDGTASEQSEGCHISGISEKAQCDFVSVAEDRKAPKGAGLDISVIRIPPQGGPSAKPPLVLLAGGPGEAASSYGAFISTALEPSRAGREIILIDQRGTGRSKAFQCDWTGLKADSDASDMAARCAVDRDRRARNYTSTDFIDDLEDVRLELDIPVWDIWAGSYGTRAAMLYAEKYPDSVGVMVLDSIAPPHIRLLENDTKTFQNALEMTFANCAKTVDCSTRFPELSTKYEKVLERLDSQALSLRDASGRTVRVDAGVFASGLQNYLYNPQFAAAIPNIIEQAHEGDLRPWAALSSDASVGALSPGLTLSVQCAEEVPRTREASIASTSFPSAFRTVFAPICKDWTEAKPNATFDEPIISDVPILILAGALDPVTPPAFAHSAAKTLPHAKVVTANAAGHAVSIHGCAPKLIAEFLDERSIAAIDGGCLNHVPLPTFVISSAGPNP